MVLEKINRIAICLWALYAAAPAVSMAQITAKGVETAAQTQSAVRQVRESAQNMSQGSKNALVVELPNVPAKVAENVWKDFIKGFKGTAKKDKKTDEWFVDNALVVNVNGSDPIDMYFKLTENNNATSAALWIDMGNIYLSSNEGLNPKFVAAEKLLQEYALAVQTQNAQIQLDAQNDELKKMDKQQRTLEKDLKNLQEDIERYKQRITKAEADIVTNNKQQTEQKAKIDNQKKLVEELEKKVAQLKATTIK